jgi:hypothetical protein
LSSRFFRPLKTLANTTTRHLRLRKRIPKVSGSTDLVKTANKSTSKANSSWIVFTEKKNSQAQDFSSHLDRNRFFLKTCRESCTKRGAVEDLEENADDEATLNHS